MTDPQHRKKKMNEAINWILSKLVKMHQALEDADDPEEIRLPSYLHIKELCGATGIPYSSAMNWSIYRTIESRFKSLSYDSNKGRWNLNPDKIQEDIRDRDEKFL